MQSATGTENMNLAGIGFVSNVTRSGGETVSAVETLPAGTAAAISATGVDGLPTGHGFVMGNVIDIAWTAGGVRMSRRGITVDTASANSFTFDNTPAAEGDALPGVATAVVVALQVQIAVAVAADEALVIAAAADFDATADIREAGATALVVPLKAGELWRWISGQGIANPLAGKTVATIHASSATANAATLRVGVLYASV